MSTASMKSNRGFTLIEVAVVFVIMALMLAAAIEPLSRSIERNKIAETDVILNDVMEALYGFAMANGRLPCPTSASANPPGAEEPAGGGNCLTGGANRVSGFVPGRTLGITGEYDVDGLLLDAWGNPIRYAVTRVNTGGAGTPDVTTLNAIRTVGIATFITQSNVVPPPNNNFLQICTTSTGSNNFRCAANATIASNAIAVVLSLGKDGARARTGGGMAGADQLENSGEANMPPGTVSGIRYRVSGVNDRVFVDRAYKNTTTGNGEFNDQIKWISPSALIAKMNAAGQLP